MNEEQRKKVVETATIEEVVISGKDISFVKENGFIPNAVETISKKTNKKHIFDLLSFWYDYEKGRMSKTDFVEKMFVYSEVNNCAISETKKKWLLEWAETESEQPQQKEKQRKVKQRKVKCFDDFISNDVKDKDSFKKRLHVSLDGKHGKQPMRDYFLPELSNGRILEGMSYEVFNKEFPNVINKADYYLIKQEKKPVPRHDKFT